MTAKYPYRGQKIPPSVRCLGLVYKVILVDDVGMLLALGRKPEAWGATDYSNMQILLLEDQSDERMWLTFCHEVAHVLADASGLVMDASEETAEKLERPLASLLAENDWTQ